MIIEGRLKGSVDQVDAMLHFEANAEEAVRPAGARALSRCEQLSGCHVRRRRSALRRPCARGAAQDMFDAQITNICLGVQSIIEKMEQQGLALEAA